MHINAEHALAIYGNMTTSAVGAEDELIFIGIEGIEFSLRALNRKVSSEIGCGSAVELVQNSSPCAVGGNCYVIPVASAHRAWRK